MEKILLIDSQKSIRNTLKEMLEHEGYVVLSAGSVPEASLLHEKFGAKVVVCSSGHFLSREYAAAIPPLPAIVTAEDSSPESVLAAIKGGALDYIVRPIDFNRLRDGIRAILIPAEEEEKSSFKRSTSRAIHKDGIVGNSHKIKHLKNIIAKVAPSDARILIVGDNGTGKELVARSIHANSKRSAAPFIEVNCAAIPSELIESELFGHEKGSFTSAVKQRKGKFELADGGTLFLDEIGDMSFPLQAKVLRALQEKRITRVGGDRDIDVDVRVLAATNKNLQEEIARHNFREDLYHRLSVIVVRVPALSERLDDIDLLVRYFIEEICAEYNQLPKEIDPAALEQLKKINWSGNVRHLRNVVERLIILSEKDISLEDVMLYADEVV